MITHVKVEELTSPIHLSWLYQKISAYENSADELKFLSRMLKRAIKKAKKTGRTQIVHRDGECCLHVHPSGTFQLMQPIKTYRVCKSPFIVEKD